MPPVHPNAVAEFVLQTKMLAGSEFISLHVTENRTKSDSLVGLLSEEVMPVAPDVTDTKEIDGAVFPTLITPLETIDGWALAINIAKASKIKIVNNIAALFIITTFAENSIACLVNKVFVKS